MTSLLNYELGNVSCGSLSLGTQSITGTGSTTSVSSSVGYVFVNASTAGEILVLPKLAEPGQTITVIQTSGTNNTVVSEASGTTILGTTVSVTHSSAGKYTTFVFVSMSLGWTVLGTTATIA